MASATATPPSVIDTGFLQQTPNARQNKFRTGSQLWSAACQLVVTAMLCCHSYGDHEWPVADLSTAAVSSAAMVVRVPSNCSCDTL